MGNVIHVRKYAAKQVARGMCSCCKVRKPERPGYKTCDTCITSRSNSTLKWCDEHYRRDNCHARR